MSHHSSPAAAHPSLTSSRAASPAREARDRRALWLRWVLLGTAVLQLASPALVGFDQTPVADPVVVPPQPWFVIWAPITLGCLAVALLGMVPRIAVSEPWRRLQVPLSITQVGFAVWLVAADRAPALTVPVFALMLVLLLWCLRALATTAATAHDRSPAPRGAGRLLHDDRLVRTVPVVTVGLYGGWTSAALWVNTATVLPGVDPDGTATGTLLTFAALLAGAVGTLALGLRLSGGQLAYAAAGIWALSGVTVSTLDAGVDVLAGVAGVGALVVLVALAVTRSRRPQVHTSTA